MRRMRVLIVEPAVVVAEGLATQLLRSGEVDVVASYRSLDEINQASDVDIVILSTSLYRQLEGCAMLAGIPLIGMQTSLSEPESHKLFSALLSIYSTDEEVVRTLREVVNSPVEHNYAESHDLSERERDVLVLVAKGYTNKEIASELFISPHTVISHRKNIVHKTGIRSVAGLTVYAVLNKLIDSESL